MRAAPRYFALGTTLCVAITGWGCNDAADSSRRPGAGRDGSSAGSPSTPQGATSGSSNAPASGGESSPAEGGGGTAHAGGSESGTNGTSGSSGSSGSSGTGGGDGGAGAGGTGDGRSGQAGADAAAGSAGMSGSGPTSGAGGPSGSAGDGSAGKVTAAPSCTTSSAGLTTCGEHSDESCCESLPVEGGTFSRTYQNSGSGPTGLSAPATIGTFRLDKYEVTVARFRAYVKYLDGGGTPPVAGSGKHTHLNGGQGLVDSGKTGSFESGWDASWNARIPNGTGAAATWKQNLTSGASGSGSGCSVYGTWTDEPGDNDLLPITCTSWYESYAFCIWDGGFLPSEAEWKYASAGGDEQRMYPWGSDVPGSNNQYAIFDCCYPSGTCTSSSGHDTCTGLVNAAPVGFARLGVGRYGQLDLSGSVWEWLLDRYSNQYVTPCEDCAYLTGSTTNRVLPGGGFHTPLMPDLLSSNRMSISYDAETYRGDYAVGVRCGRAP
jgi:sulfatase modifying factor 1